MQSVLFDKNIYNISDSRKWLKGHNFKYSGKVDTTQNYHRFRQYEPKKSHTYRTLNIKKGVKGIIRVN